MKRNEQRRKEIRNEERRRKNKKMEKCQTGLYTHDENVQVTDIASQNCLSQ